jgi:hypothetical protein
MEQNNLLILKQFVDIRSGKPRQQNELFEDKSSIIMVHSMNTSAEDLASLFPQYAVKRKTGKSYEEKSMKFYEKVKKNA